MNKDMKKDKIKALDTKMKIRKITKKIALAVIFISCISFAALCLVNWQVTHISGRYIVKSVAAPEADAVIVLGAYVFPDGRMSEMLADRLDAGYELYMAGKAGKIIVSGDHGRTAYDEVNGMRKYLQAKGVAREDIFMDHAGFDTYDSLYRARDIFKVKKLIVVTQRYHLLRAVYIAKKLGMETYGVASDYHTYPRMAYYDLREIAARAKAFLQAGVLHPKPKYLGKAIPISGSGVLTNDGK